MSVVAPTVFDCRKSAGWHEDLPQGAVMGLMSISDVWPGDAFVIAGGFVFTLEGQGRWRLADTTTGELHYVDASKFLAAKETR